MKRRQAIKALGMSAAAMQQIIANAAIALGERKNPFHKVPEKPVTAITLGAGARGNTYGGYAIKNPAELKIVGVAEPIDIRRQRYSEKHAIVPQHQFRSWEDVFAREKFADAVIITTPDHLHYGPCMRALELGYDVLLEKPIAQTEKECRNILASARKTGRIVAVCHVLRYAPYFIKLRELIHSGAIGELISIQHFEPIEHVHMAHSFVRGNWHRASETNPIILAKSCHDLDILRWLVDKPAKKIAAFGSLKWFTAANAPAGHADRCINGCAVEASCPYSALRIYYRKRSWTHVFDLPTEKEKHGEAILGYLRTTNYGRCVYKMENDQCDHLVSSILFQDGITAAFSMEAFTSYGGRRTRVMGSMGDIVGDMEKFTLTDFRNEKKIEWDSDLDDVDMYSKSGHGGGDYRLMRDWVQAVAQQKPELLSSTIDVSIESHIMGFAAEKSRLREKTFTIKM